jgi:hypothetical protein
MLLKAGREKPTGDSNRSKILTAVLEIEDLIYDHAGNTTMIMSLIMIAVIPVIKSQ